MLLILELGNFLLRKPLPLSFFFFFLFQLSLIAVSQVFSVREDDLGGSATVLSLRKGVSHISGSCFY